MTVSEYQMQPKTLLIQNHQPAQKWLKGRTLDFQDILYDKKIIKASVETERVMKEICAIKLY